VVSRPPDHPSFCNSSKRAAEAEEPDCDHGCFGRCTRGHRRHFCTT
jgi:hypothetical protein